MDALTLLTSLCGGLMVLCLLAWLWSRGQTQRVRKNLSHISEAHLTEHPEMIAARRDTLHAMKQKKRKKPNKFLTQVLLPLAEKTFEQVQSIFPIKEDSFIESRLWEAGLGRRNLEKAFLGVQVLLGIAGIVLGSLFTLAIPAISAPWGILLSLILCGLGMGFPLLWLWQKGIQRKKMIEKALPNFLDLLVISVEAGLSLDMAIHKVCGMLDPDSKSYHALQEELERYMREVSLGRNRRDALRDLGDRTGVEDFKFITGSIVQAYEMGSSVTSTLKVQANSMRTRRLQKAEERANKIPVKMVMPIYIFLFPAIFLAVVGPIAMTLADTMGQIFSNSAIAPLPGL